MRKMNFDDMTFQELKELIRSEYELLSDCSYDSPESLSQALEALLKQPVKQFPYASGVSYRCNVLKMQVIGAAIHYPYQKFTLNELCAFRGLPLKKVQDIVSKWNRRQYPYFTKLDKRTAKNENVYKLGKYAVASYLGYLKRFNRGCELNLQKPHPKKIETFVRINSHGGKMGLKETDLPEIKLT
jgi:hypothetical protein